jgi:hypothetical protein
LAALARSIRAALKVWRHARRRLLLGVDGWGWGLAWFNSAAKHRRPSGENMRRPSPCRTRVAGVFGTPGKARKAAAFMVGILATFCALRAAFLGQNFKLIKGLRH